MAPPAALACQLLLPATPARETRQAARKLTTAAAHHNMHLPCRALQFPPGASPSDKALLMNALFHIEYELFEKTGDEDDH